MGVVGTVSPDFLNKRLKFDQVVGTILLRGGSSNLITTVSDFEPMKEGRSIILTTWSLMEYHRQTKYVNELLVETIISWVLLKSNGKANDASAKNFDP